MGSQATLAKQKGRHDPQLRKGAHQIKSTAHTVMNASSREHTMRLVRLACF